MGYIPDVSILDSEYLEHILDENSSEMVVLVVCVGSGTREIVTGEQANCGRLPFQPITKCDEPVL